MLNPRFKVLFFSWIFLALATLGIWAYLFSIEPRETLLFQVFDIGQGDALFIETPDRYHILIDGGPDVAILRKLGGALSFWDRKIDLVVLTHPHADHLSGLIEVLKRYQVGAIVESNAFYKSSEYAEWERLKKERRIPSFSAVSGMAIRVGDSFLLNVVAPFSDDSGKSFSNVHDSTVITRFTYGDESFLLMGDAEAKLEKEVIDRAVVGTTTVLKIGHHGSKTSSTEEFLKAVHPDFAIISVGRKNSYGHPNPEVISRIKNLGIKLLTTAEDGDISIETDGYSLVITH